VQRVVRKARLVRVMPPHLVELESIMPPIHTPVQAKYAAVPVLRARGESKRQVSLLTGCVMDVFFSDINEATIRVLNRNGNDVTIPQGQTCCGALHAHSGDRETARQLAKQNIVAFEQSEHIIVNAAGCGCMMKEYEELLHGDAEWEPRARAFAAKVSDVSKYLYDTGFEKPQSTMNTRITYHDACHLAHGQGIKTEPRALLRAVPGVELVEMPHSDRCCGSAGIYNITNPLMANAVLDSKMRSVPEDVEMLAMGNPGCMLQMALGVKKHGRNSRVVHTMQILDWAYAQDDEAASGACCGKCTDPGADDVDGTDKHPVSKAHKNLAAVTGAKVEGDECGNA
jgi:glycolate oxidase iron-sulfur subunit